MAEFFIPSPNGSSFVNRATTAEEAIERAKGFATSHPGKEIIVYRAEPVAVVSIPEEPEPEVTWLHQDSAKP